MTNDMKVVFTIEEALGELNAGLAAQGKQPLKGKALDTEVEHGLSIGFEVLEELGAEQVYQILGTDVFEMERDDLNPVKAFQLNVAVEAVKNFLEASGGKTIPYSQADIGFLPTIVLIFKEDANGSNDKQSDSDLAQVQADHDD